MLNNSSMKEYNEDLDKEFKRLGFASHKDMLKHGVFLEKFMMLNKTEWILRPPGNGTQQVRFGFTVVFGKNGGRDQITMIAATLKKSVLLDQMKLSLDAEEMRFGIENGPLPTKNEIINKMSAKILQFEQIKKIVKVFNIGLINMEQEKLSEQEKTPIRIKL